MVICLAAGYPGGATAQMAAFAAQVGHPGAAVMVAPEYNRSFPAQVKQAFDSSHDEWRAKRVGSASHGWRFLRLAARMYAVEQVRIVPPNREQTGQT